MLPQLSADERSRTPRSVRGCATEQRSGKLGDSQNALPTIMLGLDVPPPAHSMGSRVSGAPARRTAGGSGA